MRAQKISARGLHTPLTYKRIENPASAQVFFSAFNACLTLNRNSVALVRALMRMGKVRQRATWSQGVDGHVPLQISAQPSASQSDREDGPSCREKQSVCANFVLALRAATSSSGICPAHERLSASKPPCPCPASKPARASTCPTRAGCSPVVTVASSGSCSTSAPARPGASSASTRSERVRPLQNSGQQAGTTSPQNPHEFRTQLPKITNQIPTLDRRLAVSKLRPSDARWSSLVARRAHNPKVGGSNPPRATDEKAL
jgi:hypothetical protein